LKSCFGGVLMVLVAKDASNSLVSIILGFITIENSGNWVWFIQEANAHLDGVFSHMNLVLIIDW